MFFPEKIRAIRDSDKVLEIGPGSTPHRRSNAFLELDFSTAEAKIAQRGGDPKDAEFGEKQIFYYDGNRFPFEDGEFDYVICSHVIEHVIDPVWFLGEVFRVGGGRGYIEYPLVTYEYLYDFDVHLHFVKFDFERQILRFIPKSDTGFSEFSSVRSLLYRTLECGWDDLCASNKKFYFEGFEFDRPFSAEKGSDLVQMLPSRSLITRKRSVRKLVGQILNKAGL